MKKLFLAVAVCLLASANSFAQYQPEAGTVTTELQFNPFNQNNQNFAVNGLKLRYFLSEQHALRLNLGFGINSNKFTDEGTLNDADRTPWNEDLKSKTGNFTLGVGYEYHINIAPRLSVYLGGETGFTVTNAKTTVYGETGNTETDVTFKNYYTANVGGFDPDYTNPFAGLAPVGAFTFNLNLLTGFDFYMYKGLYCGTEFGLAIQSSKFKKLEIEGKVNGTDINEEAFENNSKRSSVAVAFNAIPAIRLGWRF